MKHEVITHDGVVKSIEGQHVCVTILQSSACSGCAAKSMCASAEAKEKEVVVPVPEQCMLEVGQKVLLEGRVADGRRAALIAYGLPLLLMLPVLFVALRLTGSETMGALIALAAVAVYYLCIYLFFRQRLQQRFTFRLRQMAS